MSALPVETELSPESCREMAERLERRAEELRVERLAILSHAYELRTQADVADNRSRHVAPKPRPVIASSKGREIPERELDLIVSAVTELQPTTSSAVAEHLNVSVPMAQKRLKKCEELGRLARSGAKSGTRWFLPGEGMADRQDGDYKAKVIQIAYELTQGGNVFLTEDVEAAGVGYGAACRWLKILCDEGTLRREKVGKGYVYERPRVADNTPRVKRETPESAVVRQLPVTRRRGSAIQGTGRASRLRSSDSAVRELLGSCRAHNLTVKKTDGNHFQVFQGERLIATFASTPSDHRAIPNARADIRRLTGLPV